MRFITEGYLEITFGTVLNVAARPTDSTAEIISLSLSIFIVIPLVIFPFMSAALLYDKTKEIKEGNERYLKRFGTMYAELKQDKEWYCIQFYPIFLIRRLVFILFLIFMISQTEMQ